MLRNWLSRRLSTKLVTTMLLMLGVSITFTSLLYYRDSTGIIADQVRESSRQSAKQSADYMSLILTVASDMSLQISRDATIQRVLQEEARGSLTVDDRFQIKETVDQLLNNLVYTNSFIRSIYLLQEEGSNWGSGLFNISKVRRYTLSDHDWYTDVAQGRADDRWLPLQYDPFSGGSNTELVLTYVKPLRNLQTRQAIGAIVINLDGHVVLQAIDRIRLGKTGKFFIVDPEGRLMIDPDEQSWSGELLASEAWQSMRQRSSLPQEFELELGGIRYYAVTSPMASGWAVIGGVPIGEIVGDIQNIQYKIWLYSGILLLLGSLVSWLLSRRITSPLKQLMRQMAQLERSNFRAMTEVTSQDEVGQLSRQFNRMLRQIEQLITQVNEVESKKREAEMRALRHQINPHFLYNTLSTIRWMVKFKRYDGVYDGISALVQLMEASMEKRGPFLTIGDELSLIERYMVIQRFRYDARLELTVDCDPALLDVSIPRMLLQPIVENAIFHGIAPKETGGLISLSIREEAAGSRRQLVLRIADDGVGIAPERLGELLVPGERSRAGMLGIGLSHVHETIQLYYGEQSGLRIRSELGAGTEVELRLLRKEEMDDAV
ncbi:sensor histidine kinase [Paenibacillus sp. 598K]|uniref:cache domain-containing sensor histidine kinase n=1 Tax=Paenibacillus sp. 598K TaxID=1117987 RepID=UPI000FFAFD5E|nr:sensor histidine kinase [Paenibacillus sp. 598K]GBF74650.1 sensor histidine kinase [Paenibacillus sp. 598K]